MRRSVQLIDGFDSVSEKPHHAIRRRFQELVESGRIEFTTFHQSYGYEEFVEGIRPVLNEAGDRELRYQLHNGVFKRIAARAAGELDFDSMWDELTLTANENKQWAEANDAWTPSDSATRISDERILKTKSGENCFLAPPNYSDEYLYVIRLTEEGKLADIKYYVWKEYLRTIWSNRDTFTEDPSNLDTNKMKEILDAEPTFTGIWVIYAEIHKIAERIRTRGEQNQTGYVLIIDEINRGNISKIFGELITLIEPNKRLGMPDELTLRLPYSQKKHFGVPRNLHILATMNTADRSIALMDVALRRRFTFEEIMPDSDVIRKQIGDTASAVHVDLVVDLFETINKRIRFVLDRDHLLGHSYFLEADNLQALRITLTNRVIPLLQEYFYGEWDKICAVLGCPYDERGNPLRRSHNDCAVDSRDGEQYYIAPVISASVIKEVSTLGFDHEVYEDQVEFSVSETVVRSDSRDEDLARTFFCVLSITNQELTTRMDALLGNPESSATDDKSG